MSNLKAENVSPLLKKQTQKMGELLMIDMAQITTQVIDKNWEYLSIFENIV